jgi:transposase
MRKMQDFIVKSNRIFIGLEDSKRTWKLCVRCDRMIVHETSMPAEYDNLRRYLKGRYPDCEIQVMYEAGFSGFWLHDLLEEDGIDCIVTPPNKVTQEKVNKVKTDKIDARRLAKNLENEDYTSCHIPDRELREDRQISRTMNQIQRIVVSTKNRIRKFLDFHGLNGDLPAGAWRSSHYKILRELTLSKPLQICLNGYLRVLDEACRVKSELELELRALCKKERYRKSVETKQSCPGVGWLSAIRFTLEWGDMTRFSTGKKIASFIGFTGSEYSTAEMIRRGHITKQGSGQVRAWLIQCAWRAIRIDQALQGKFKRVWRNSGSKKKAIVAVARKMAVRMRALEVSETTGGTYCLGVIK